MKKIQFEVTDNEYSTIRGSFVSAIQLYDQEIEECTKVLNKNGPDPMLEETVKYWKVKKSEAVEVRDKLLEQSVKGAVK